MAWQAVAVMCVLFTVLLVAPGALLLRSIGVRGLTALGAGAAVSSALWAAATAVLATADVAWRPVPAIGTVVVLGALLAMVAALVRRRADARVGLGVVGPRRTVRERVHARWAARTRADPAPWVLVLVLVLASMLAIVPVAVGMGGPDAPLQQWDAAFHLNGVALIRETGDASSLHGLYGAGKQVYYPTVWHSLVALLPVTGATGVFDVSAAANASTVAMASVGWFLGLAALAREVFPTRRWAPALVIAVGGAFSMFPTVQLSTLAQWPNAMSVMLLPGTCALVVAAVRASRDRVPRTRQHAPQARRPGPRAGILWSAALGAVVGVGAVHGTGVFGFLVLVGPYLVATVWGAARHAVRDGRGRLVAAWCAAVLVLGAAAVAVLLTSPVMAVLLRFERVPQRDYWESVPRTVFDLVLTGGPGNLVVSCAVLVGAGVLLRAREHRWIIVSAVAVCALTALAAGPAVPLRAVTGLWYAQGARIEALYPIPAALLAVVGIAWAGERLGVLWAARRTGGPPTTEGAEPRASEQVTRRAAAVVLVLLAVASSGGYQAAERAERFAEAYDPDHIRWGTMLSAAEIDLMRRLPGQLPDDARILGDPSDGAVFAYALAGVDVVLPQLGTSGMDAHQAYLRASFRDIREDPLVCEHLAAVGATHLYVDPTGAEGGAKVDALSPGLQDIDTTGFRLVESGGAARLYEITACR